MRPALCILVLAAHAAAPQEPRVLVSGAEERGAPLGRVLQVAVVSDGFIVLERTAPYLRYFDASGRLRQSLGRTGSGPGEFRSPFSMTTDTSTRRLLVVDPQNARLTAYTLADTLSLRGTYAVDVPMARAVCALGDRVMALAGVDSMVLRELARRDERFVEVARLGHKSTQHPLAKHPILANYVADGPLACTPDLRFAYVASGGLGEILIQPLEGGRAGQWQSVPGFRPVTIRSEGRGIQIAYKASGLYESIVSLKPTPAGVTATLARRDVVDGAVAVVGYREVVLSVEGLVLGSRLTGWRALGSLQGREYCYRDEPVPTIGVMERGGCP